MSGMRFAKGHGTGNDFVVLPDPDGALDVPPALVAALCDRRFGIGGDGVLRVVPAAKHPESTRLAGEAEWFMDYRNADGSVAEMCGNGVRVFARYLVEEGLVSADRFAVATRAGLVEVAVGTDLIEADLRVPALLGAGTVRLDRTELTGTRVDVGNPHLVCPVPDVSTMDLTSPPVLDPAVYPDGANVEIVSRVPDANGVRVRMRVYERGSGETLSCGTGACAVAAVALHETGSATGTVAVDLPGGRLTITLDGAHCRLAGPAVIVARGELAGPHVLVAHSDLAGPPDRAARPA